MYISRISHPYIRGWKLRDHLMWLGFCCLFLMTTVFYRCCSDHDNPADDNAARRT